MTRFEDATRIEGSNTAPGTAATPVPAGTKLGRYLVVRPLGSGGMGEVYAAYDPELDRRVAVKLLRVAQGDSQGEMRRRLLREAQALAKLSHPNVVAVYDVGAWEDRVFVAMEHVEGVTVRQWLEDDDTRPWRDVVRVFLAAGEGLSAAHAQGLVHRDFKPSNVMIADDGRVRVLDFGLARRFGDDDLAATDPNPRAQAPGSDADGVSQSGSSASLDNPLTETGVVMGTPGYMAPEQFLGRTVDARTDQFSFCVSLYEALFGRRPFPGRTYDELSRAVRSGDVATSVRHSGLPGPLRSAVLRGLSVRPSERYASIPELMSALRRAGTAPRRRLIIAGGVVIVGALGSVVYASATRVDAPLCAGADAHSGQVWNAARKQAIAAAFASTDKPYAEDALVGMSRIVDGYTDGWVAMRTDACEATRVRGEQSEHLLDLRMSCLDDRLSALGAVVELFETADAEVVLNAVNAADALPPLSECADGARLRAAVSPPSDPEKAAEVARIRQQIDKANALAFAGKYREALVVGREALEQARANGHTPLIGEAWLHVAQVEERSASIDEALEAYDQALWAATRSGHEIIQAKAMVGLVSVIGYHKHETEHGLRQAGLAEAALSRIDDRADLHALLELYRANTLFGAARLDEAEAAFQRVIGLAGDRPEAMRAKIGAMQNVGAVHGSRGDHRKAGEFFARALELTERRLGPHHPAVAASLNNLGVSKLKLEEYDEALALEQRALSIWTEALGPEHPDLAKALHNLGTILAKLGRREEAMQRFERAVVLKEAALGPNHPSLALTHTNIGDALLQLERYEESLQYFERAKKIWLETVGPDHPSLSYALSSIGEAHLGLQQYDEAIEPLERAVAIRKDNPLDPHELGNMRLYLALALDGSGRDPQRAEALVRAALEDYAHSDRPSDAAVLRAKRWLDEHR